MKILGIYMGKGGRVYDLIYFPEKESGQAIEPFNPENLGVARVVAEVHASSDSEAKELLIEKLSGIEVKGPSFLTTTTTTSGVTRTTSTTLPPELINADPEFVSKNASDLIVQDNPELKPIEQVIARHVRPLLSGSSSEEELDTESVRKTGKLEINIKYAPNLFIGHDAYFGDHVGSMGPTLQNLNLIVNQTWQEVKTNYDQDVVAEELRKVAEKLDATEDRADNLQDAAVIEKAANEMTQGNGPKALRLLSKVSKEVLAASKEIGTNIATELIMKMTGLR
jgi:hypothetical protein